MSNELCLWPVQVEVQLYSTADTASPADLFVHVNEYDVFYIPYTHEGIHRSESEGLRGA